MASAYTDPICEATVMKTKRFTALVDYKLLERSIMVKCTAYALTSSCGGQSSTADTDSVAACRCQSAS